MTWCTTIDSKNQLFATSKGIGFLHLSEIDRTTSFWDCYFSFTSESDHKFKGSLYFNNECFENITGTLNFDNIDKTMHYEIFQKENKKPFAEYDTTLSFKDYQNTLVSYEPIVQLK